MKVTHAKATLLPGKSAVYISVLWNNFVWKFIQFTLKNQPESVSIINLFSLPFMFNFPFLNQFLKKSKLTVYMYLLKVITKYQYVKYF